MGLFDFFSKRKNIANEPKDTSRDTLKDISKDKAKNISEDISNDKAKDISNDKAKNTSKDIPKDNAVLEALVHSDSVSITSDEEVNNFTQLIGDEYVAKRQLDLTEEELEKMSITAGAEMWRLYTWFHNNVMPDDTEEKYLRSQKRINRLGKAMAKKILDIDEIYYLYNKITGEAHLFSQTVKRGDGYICTNPNIRVFTKAYVDYEIKKYPDTLFEFKRIERGSDNKGITNFLGECFYLNGAKGVEINGESAVIDASMLVPQPDFTGMSEVNIPVMNPNLMCWMLLMAQMQKAETADEQLIYRLYYQFMAKEVVKAKFLVPMKIGKDFPKPDVGEKFVVKSGAEFAIASMKGKNDKDAIIMYTDWKRLRECYDGWNGTIMTLSQIIDVNDVAINPTNHPQLGFYIGKDMYEDMMKIANK